MSLIVLTHSSHSYHVLITLFWVDCTVIGVNKKYGIPPEIASLADKLLGVVVKFKVMN